MSDKLNNAKALYLEGIRDGNARAAITKYTGDRYTQHSTGVADGVEGFVAFFEDFVERNPVRDIQIIRGLVDGPYVFVQALQDLNNGAVKWVTMDLFDTDQEDKIIEHWDVIAPFAEHSVSGNTQIDGPTEVLDLAQTGANKASVQAFVDCVLLTGDGGSLEEFVATDCIQHNPEFADGFAGFPPRSGLHYQSLFKLIGQGNFVVTYCKASRSGDDYAVFDLYRLQEGMIVEHWCNAEVILPPEQWGNSGKF